MFCSNVWPICLTGISHQLYKYISVFLIGISANSCADQKKNSPKGGEGGREIIVFAGGGQAYRIFLGILTVVFRSLNFVVQEGWVYAHGLSDFFIQTFFRCSLFRFMITCGTDSPFHIFMNLKINFKNLPEYLPINEMCQLNVTSQFCNVLIATAIRYHHMFVITTCHHTKA